MSAEETGEPNPEPENLSRLGECLAESFLAADTTALPEDMIHLLLHLSQDSRTARPAGGATKGNRRTR